MATPMQSMVKTIAAIVQCSSREKAVNWRRWVGHAHSPFRTSAGVIALGCFVSPARLVNDCEYTAERALSNGIIRWRDARGQHQGVES